LLFREYLLSEMVKTNQKKALIGQEFINNLTLEQDCKPFTKGKDEVMDCKCCSKFACNLDVVKETFHGLHKEFWALPRPEKIPAKDLSGFEGELLAKFLDKYCTFLSIKKPFYEFPVPMGDVIITLCLPTAMRVFGATKFSFQVVQKHHTQDKKKVGLSILKFAVNNPKALVKPNDFYFKFRRWFP